MAFGFLRNKLFGRKEPEFDELRSHILGETYPPYPPGPTPPMPERRFEPEREAYPERYPERPGLELPEFSRERETSPFPGLGKPEKMEREYEIMDRLALIEAQLSAIRSQTETINERLKNLEMKLTKRY